MLDLTSYSVPELRELLINIQKEILSRPASEYRCAVCSGIMYSTPSGMVCEQGHGGTEEVKVELDPEPPQFTQIELTQDQQTAWGKLNKFLALSEDEAPIFVLKGFAGTGKSFMMKKLLDLPHNFIFSAPTNKASKVLSDFLDQPVKTTYSVLGLRMTAEEDQLVLKAHPVPDLGNKPILVIDECGMVPKFMATMLKQACADHDWRIIFVGDPAQWNPIGEPRSIVWSMAPPEHRAMLREVRRFDNEILVLSTKIRERIIEKNYSVKIRNDNSNGEGVFVLSHYEFLQKIKSLKLEDWAMTKVTAWRNSTVDGYNKLIRKSLGFTKQYEPNDLVLMGAPLLSDDAILAHTDEELKIISVEFRIFTFPEGEIQAYAIAVQDKPYTLFVPKDPGFLESMLSKRAARASSLSGRERTRAWASFWELKNTFQLLRYGYAMTTHRLQGTTLDHVFVDQQDILSNPNKLESFRGLYVSATRPRKTFTTY